MKHVMQTTFSFLCMFALITMVSGQDDKSSRPSPPAQANGTIGNAEIMISYSSPAVKDRTIWGDLVPYGKIWRTGANEATVFETSADIMINGGSLPAGKYSLFTIPGEENWTVIFNSDWEQWGSYQYNASKDVLRVEATPETGAFQERLQFMIEGEKVVLAWEKLVLPLTVQ